MSFSFAVSSKESCLQRFQNAPVNMDVSHILKSFRNQVRMTRNNDIKHLGLTQTVCQRAIETANKENDDYKEPLKAKYLTAITTFIQPYPELIPANLETALQDDEDRANLFSGLGDELGVENVIFKKAEILCDMFLHLSEETDSFDHITMTNDDSGNLESALDYKINAEVLWIESFVSLAPGSGGLLLHHLVSNQVAVTKVKLAAYGGSEAYYLGKGFTLVANEVYNESLSDDGLEEKRIYSWQDLEHAISIPLATDAQKEQFFNDNEFSVYKVYEQNRAGVLANFAPH